MVVGVLAVQGNFARHEQVLHHLGVETILVKTEAELYTCDRLVLPGGESSVFLHHLEQDFLARLGAFCASHPVFATCAGLILLAKEVKNPEQNSLGVLDVSVVRNAYGRQTDSFFTSEIELTEHGRNSMKCSSNLCGAFIRAPLIAEVNETAVTVLAKHKENPVLVQQGSIVAATYHPELAENELRVHELFITL
jgi:pyridoxal 5'-phosphate synthase pdxT subunit